MKKFLCALLTLTCISVPSYASEFAEKNPIAYIQTDEGYEYGKRYVATNKETGEIIPLAEGPFYECAYAYMPDGGEFEITKHEPEYFSDTQDTFISEMHARGVMNGYPDGTFREKNTLTRAEMGAVFCRMFQVAPSDAKSCFSDVSEDDWHCKSTMALVERGVFKKDTYFNPDDPVTREQYTAMLYRMLCDMGFIKDLGEYNYTRYTDLDKVSDYARTPYNGLLTNNYKVICEFVENEFLDSADDEFLLLPNQGVTRYECAENLYKFIGDFFDNNAPAIKRSTAPDIEIPVIDGSTSTYKITENIYNLYYLNSNNLPTMPKSHSKTTNSYKRLIDGEVEMIFVPDPGEEVKQYAKDKGVTLRYIPIAGEALVFFTGKENPSDKVTTEQLKEIYINNSVENWAELGGADAPLVPFCRNEDSGSHAQIDKFVLGGEEIHSDIQRERTSVMMSSIFTDLDDFEASHPGEYGIGYSLYFYYYHNVVFTPDHFKLLSVDGIAPSDKTIADKTYPYTTQYYAVIRDEENPKVDAFLDLMQGEFGETVILRSGYGTLSSPEGYPID